MDQVISKRWQATQLKFGKYHFIGLTQVLDHFQESFWYSFLFYCRCCITIYSMVLFDALHSANGSLFLIIGE